MSSDPLATASNVADGIRLDLLRIAGVQPSLYSLALGPWPLAFDPKSFLYRSTNARSIT